MSFSWSLACDDEEEFEKIISFYVLDIDGNIIGKEDIPFSIKKDGYYWFIDTI